MLFHQNQRCLVKFSGSKPKYPTWLPFLSKFMLPIGFWKESIENHRPGSRAVSWLQAELAWLALASLILSGQGSAQRRSSVKLSLPCLCEVSDGSSHLSFCLLHPILSFVSLFLSLAIFDQFAAGFHHLLLRADFSPDLPTPISSCPEMGVPL